MRARVDDLAINLEGGRATLNRVQVGEVERVEAQRVPDRTRQRNRFRRSVQDALNRLIIGASSSDGMDGLAIQQVDDRNDLEGHGTMAPESACTILVHEWVTGGGLYGSELPASWAAEGLAMRRAIAADFACLPDEPVRVMVTSDPRLPADHGPWTIVPGHDSARVRELARIADFTVLIAPETSGILASITRELEHAGARLLGSTADAVELAADKARLAARLQELSIETPTTRTIIPAAGLPHDVPYPAVLKPVDGAGSVDTFYLADALSLPDQARAMPVALLQPFVPGTPMSASFFIGQDRPDLADRRGNPANGDSRGPVCVSRRVTARARPRGPATAHAGG